MTNNYHIVLQDGVNQSDLYSLVTSVVDEIPFRSTYFIAECTDAQAQTLRDHDSVKFVNKPAPISSTEEDDDTLTKTVNYRRMRKHHLLGGYSTTYAGNWGLLRHQGGITDNVTPQSGGGVEENNIAVDDSNTDQSGTYTHPVYNDGTTTTDLDGTGVDIIMPLGTILDRTDTEFFTNGSTRLESFQWNTLTGMNTLPTVEYANLVTGRSGASDSTIQHSEAVAYIACSNTYGWATGSKIYVFPRNQMNNAGKDPFEYFYDCARLFHEAKAGTADADRPTVVISSFSKKLDTTDQARGLLFRNRLYFKLAPGGGEQIPVQEISFGSAGDISSGAFGRKYLCPRSGYIDLPSQANAPYEFKQGAEVDFSSADDVGDAQAEFIDMASDDATYNAEYAVYMEPVKDMTDAGVHHIVAAGNAGAKLCLPTNPDYNNAYIDPLTSSPEELHKLYFYNRPGWHVGPDTIVVGALSSNIYNNSNTERLYSTYRDYDRQTPGGSATSIYKEIISSFSNKGDRVDTCAAGENIYLNLASLGTSYTYIATGTSFACPQVGGMVAQILQAYPTTSVSDMRKYIRDIATTLGTSDANNVPTVIDPPMFREPISPTESSPYGDLAYFAKGTHLMGYSGNIVTHPQSEFSNLTILSNLVSQNNGGAIIGTPDIEAVRNPQVNYTIAEINEKLS